MGPRRTRPSGEIAVKIDFEGTVHEFPDDFTDDDISAALASQQKPKPAVDKPLPRQSGWPTNLLGPLDAGLSMASGAVAAPLAGLAGLATGGNADTVHNVQDALTYQPRTEVGQGITNAVAWPFEKLAQGADYAGQKVADLTGSPAAGALTNTALQAAPMALTPAAGRGARGRVNRQAGEFADRRAANVEVDAARARARESGVIARPTQIRNNAWTRLLERVSGADRMDARTLQRNADTFNRLARESVNLRQDQPLSPTTLRQVRQQHGRAYEDVKQITEPLIVNPEYRTSVADIGGARTALAREFPEIVRNEQIAGLRNSLLPEGAATQMSPAAAVELVRELRSQATRNFRAADGPSPNPGAEALARAQRQAADAVDQLIQDNLEQRFGRGEVFQRYVEARQQIARTHDIESALNETTQNVNAARFSRLIDDQRPLDPRLRTIGEAHQAFPGATRAPQSAPLSAPIDYALNAAMALLGHGAAPVVGAAVGLARPAMRAAMLSRPIQRMLMRPDSYQPNMRMRALAAALDNRLAPVAVGGMQGAQ